MTIAVIFIVTVISVLIVFIGIRLISKLKKGILLGVTLPVILVYVGLLIIQPDNLLISNALVLITSIMVGSLLGMLISNEASVIVFSVTAAIVDLVSFSGGITAKIISNYQSGGSLLLHYLSISIPVGSKIIPIVGIGDFIIVGAIFYSLKRLNYTNTECFLVPTIGLLIALVVGLIVGGIYAVPFIATAVIVFFIYRRVLH